MLTQLKKNRSDEGLTLETSALNFLTVANLKCNVKGKISDREFLHIDQSLKPRPCRPFLIGHLLAKGTIYLKHLHISRVNTFIPLERLDNSGSNSPPKPGTDDGQMLVSCRAVVVGGGGILKLRIDRRMTCLQESLKKKLSPLLIY